MRPQLLLPAAAALLLTAVRASPIAPAEDITAAEIEGITLSKTSVFGNTAGSLCGCTLLSLFAFGKVFYPGSETYARESTHYWSRAAYSQPSCVFVPASARDVARGLSAAKVCQAELGIRGGGHMPVPGYAGVKNGILFAATGLDTLRLAADGRTLELGPAHRWTDVYRFLEPHGLYAVGGRVGIVGVPGLILGGGVNFFANKFGFAMDNVVSFEVVLASAHVVTATATNAYSDLFWALKGGSSNFGIVTKFEIQVYAVPTVWTGITQFNGTDENLDDFYTAIANLANSGYETLGAGAIPQIAYTPGAGVTGITVLMHEGPDPNPRIFADFHKMPVLPGGGNYTVTTPLTTSLQLSEGFAGTSHVFRVHSTTASKDAIKFVWDTISAHIPALEAAAPSLVTNGVAIQPVPSSALRAGARNGGNAFGIKADENYIWYCLSASWLEDADGPAINAWIEDVGGKISAGARERGFVRGNGREFLYLNDAQGGQDVFAGYGAAEVERLKTVREKYDAGGRVFGKSGLSKGGFKF
ncbi:hypothetical protein DFH27DRAFT_341880 [Peziza echinospora]|nr:hypothetical protein DFH27DRAFT_341880 [Peziza echinospora]